MGEATTPAVHEVIARQLNALMTRGGLDGTGPTTTRAVAAASKAYAKVHGGPTISHASVSNILAAVNPNVGLQMLIALANVYGVEVTYFFEKPGGETPRGEEVLRRLVSILSGVLPEDQPLTTDTEIAAAVAAQGCVLAEAAIADLRAGRWDDALRDPLRSLATGIGIRPLWADCFIDGSLAAMVQSDLETLKAIQKTNARVQAFRGAAEDLADDAFQAIQSLMQVMRKDSGGKRNRL